MGVGGACSFKQCSQGSHIENVTFEQRFEEGEGIRHANISGNEQQVQ